MQLMTQMTIHETSLASRGKIRHSESNSLQTGLNELATGVDCPTSDQMKGAIDDGSRDEEHTSKQYVTSKVPDDFDAAALLDRESILRCMGIKDATGRAQLDSILEYAQELGLVLSHDEVKVDALYWQISARLGTPKGRGLLPGLEVTLVIEKKKRTAERLYTSRLLLRAGVVEGARRRRAHDLFLEKAVPLSEDECAYGTSFPDGEKHVYCFLVVERPANRTEWLSASIKELNS